MLNKNTHLSYVENKNSNLLKKVKIQFCFYF